MSPRIILSPPVFQDDDLAQLKARARFHFAGAARAGAEVLIECGAPNLAPGPAPAWLDDAAGAPEPRCVSGPVPAERDDWRVFHDRAAFLAAPGRQVVSADSLLDLDAPDQMNRVAAHIMKQLGAPGFAGASGFERLKAALAGSRRVVLVGSGPSVRTMGPAEEADVTVYAGSAVLDAERLKARPPHIIVGSDIAGQLGPSMTAARWREAVFAAQSEYGAWILLAEPHASPLRAWWPDALAERVIALPEDMKRPLGADLREAFSHRPTGNVLTALLLPLAASLSDVIHAVGFDGADAGRPARFWSHADEAGYQRHVAAALLAHPASGQGDPLAYQRAHQARVVRQCAALRARKPGLQLTGLAHAADDEVFSDSDRLTLRQRAAMLVFRSLERLSKRPWVAGLAAASGVGLAMMFQTLSLAGLAAACVLVIVTGLLYLRRRVDIASARAARRLAAEQSKTLRALSARIDALEGEDGSR